MGYLGRSPTPSPIDSSDIPDNSIDASKIIDGAIAVADVADGAITEAKIADAAVVSLKSGRKNLIINGGFDVWQRGTTGAIVSAGYATADRWKGNLYTNGTVLLEKKTDATGQDFTTYARFQQSVAGTVAGQQGFVHIIEGTHAVGKTITISFKARASKSLASCWVRGAIAPQTYDLTTGWQSFSFTGTGVASGGNTWVMFDFGLENDTWYVDLAQVQAELGSVATDFEHRSFGEELALCQRYYEKLVQTAIAHQTSADSSHDYLNIYWSVKRDIPTLTHSGWNIAPTGTGGLSKTGCEMYKVGGFYGGAGLTFNINAEIY